MRMVLVGTALVASLTLASVGNAAQIVGDLSTWTAAVGPYAQTTQTGYSDFTFPVPSISLTDGQTLGFSDSLAEVYTAGGSWGAFANGYNGQVIDTSGKTMTITLSPAITALGFLVQPDGNPDTGDTISVTLSDQSGATFSFNETAPNQNLSQFVGFYGGGITSITIGVTAASDFVVGDFFDSTSVPEPVSMALLMPGLTALTLVRRARPR
jgi:hypothetical protein